MADRLNAAETIVEVLKSGFALKMLFHVVVPVVGAPQSERPCVIEYDLCPNGDGVNIRRVDPKIPDAIWVTNHPLLVSRPNDSGDSGDRYRKIEAALIDVLVTRGTKIGFDEARAIMSSVSMDKTLYSVVAWPRQRKLMVATSPGVAAFRRQRELT